MPTNRNTATMTVLISNNLKCELDVLHKFEERIVGANGYDFQQKCRYGKLFADILASAFESEKYHRDLIARCLDFRVVTYEGDFAYRAMLRRGNVASFLANNPDIEVGWVYVMTNPSMPYLVKVGCTRQTPEMRAKNLKHEGIPRDYEVRFSLLVEYPCQVESTCHKMLSRVRDGGEWFRCSEAVAENVISQISKTFAIVRV